MKNNNSQSRFTLIGFVLFLLPLTISISLGIVIYDLIMTRLNSYLYVAIFLFIYIIIITLAFTFIDIFRRKLMIDRPVKQILDATQKIANGKFDIKLEPLHDFSKYDEYDLIIENINKMAKELSKSEILKNDFISSVSHEIKTPLANIQNYSKALAKGNLDLQTKQKYLNNLVNTTNKISNLISNILKLNKLENQTIILSHEKINIGELLRESILTFDDKISQKDIQLNCNIQDILQKIDGSYLEIIFNNLISNAIKFTGVGGKIDISLTQNHQQIIFEVKDNGIGMAEDVGRHIFDKFYQGDSSRAGEGNGLGLALVKKIIDILGGEIIVRSKQNEGSVFIVKLKKDMYEI